MDPLTLLIDILADRVEARLRERTDGRTVYSTESPEIYPPRSRSRRHARERIRRAGGVQIGAGRESQWQIDRATFDAAETRRPALRVVSTEVDDDLAIVDAALEGLRPTRATGNPHCNRPMIGGAPLSPKGAAK